MDRAQRELELIDGAMRQADAVRPPPQSPDWIPGLRIQRQIHRGGQADVYEAHQLSTGRSVVVKVFSRNISDEPSLRFHREVNVLGKLRHPNIVAIHDSGVVDGRSYVVMDLIRGVPLNAWAQDVCRSGAVLPGSAGIGDRSHKERIVCLFVRVCDAVNQAHLLGIIHRDLKPGNVLVDEDDQPHVLDFGLAKLTTADSLDQSLTLDGQFVGSLAWASPEQAALKPALVDVRTDVYSMGVLLYNAMTGGFPYDVDRGLQAVLSAIMQTEPLPPGRMNPRVDGELETIILKCLAKEPTRRYQNAGEIGRDLQRYLDGAAIDAKRDSTWYVVRKNLRRYRVPVVTAAMFALLLLGSAVVSTLLYLREDQQRRLAEAAEERAQQRAAQVERVAEFQARQLAGIDPVSMGLGLRENLLHETRIAMERGGASQDEIDHRMSQLDRAMFGTDFTNIALKALQANVFDPTLTAIESGFDDQPLVKARLLQTGASTLRVLGLAQMATAAQEEALAIREKMLGRDHPDTLESMHEMAALCMDRGLHEKAKAYYLEALAGRRKVLGDDDPATLGTLNELGFLMVNRLRDFDGAEPYLREALERCRRVLGDDHADTLHARRNLGTLLKAQGKLDEAEPHYRRAVEGMRRVAGDDDPNTLSFINDLGILLLEMNKPSEAEPYVREALDGYRGVLGREHPLTLNSNASMGFLLRAIGRHAEAEPYFRETLRGRRRVLGEQHPHTLKSVNDLGWLLTKMGRLSEAATYFSEAYEGRRRVLGEEHHDTLNSVNNLAAINNKLGHHEDAITLLRQMEPAARRVWTGSQSHWLGNYLGKLGEAQTGMGDYAAAEATLLEAYPLLVAGFGEDHPATLQCVRRLVALYDAWNGTDPDGPYAAKATEWRDKLGG